MDFIQDKINSPTKNFIKYLQLAVDIYILARIFIFLFTFLDSSLIFKDTILTGGDTASWYSLAHYLKTELLPSYTLSGWHPGNSCGYPLFQFYFSLPFLLSVMLSYFIPLTIGLKIVTILGSIFLPFLSYFAFKKMNYRFPLPAIAACLCLVFLFQGDYTMFGGNLKSTFAGEFCYSFSFMFFAYYLASLYFGLNHKKNLLINSILLALIGLIHSFVFLVALLLPIFFIFNKKTLIANIKYLIRLNLLAFLLMGFWILPFLATKEYMMPFYLIWVFNKKQEVLFPSIFIFATAFVCRALLLGVDKIFEENNAPQKERKILFKTSIFLLATLLGFFIWKFLWEKFSIPAVILFVLPLLIFIIKYHLHKKGIYLKTRSNRPYRYFCFITLIAILLYMNAHLLEIPDIRFLPVVVFMLLFISVDLLGYLIFFIQGLIKLEVNTHSIRRNLVAFVILAIIALGSTEAIFKFSSSIGQEATDWFKYNYSGYEALPSWKEFKSINEHLAGDFSDPRVAYEKSNLYERYGTDRVFESLPYFSGRATLEGILFSSSFLSKSIMSLQAEFSKETLAPIAYAFPRINTSILPSHFEMFNIGQIIVASQEMKDELSKHPNFKEEFKRGEIKIFKYTGELGYVSVSKNYPLIYNGPNWKNTFYKWFRQLNTNDIPIVPKDFVKESDRERIFFKEVTSLTELAINRKPISGIDQSKISAKVEPFSIRFSTPYLGLPHIIKVSYFPNWKVKGAKDIYPIAPGFMMVIPQSRDVLLYYSKTAFDWTGIGLSILGIILILYCAFSKKEPFGNLRFISSTRISQAICKYHKKIMMLILILIGLSTIYCYQVRNYPVRAYRKGSELFSQKRYKEAIHTFNKVIEKSSLDIVDRTLSMLFCARAHFELGNRDMAVELYQRIIKEYPDSRYIAESYYEIGQIYRSLGKNKKALESLKKAATIDKYSLYVEHAKASIKDMKNK
ncbi:MAG: tetratricopeptide repeat protein [Candidatus Omnitrophica bacterium]|nr:tetratricopeptide repeat protein [Candidatus Omnitrophota bacterium]